MLLETSGSGKKVWRLSCVVLGEEEGIGSEMRVGRGTQRQNLASVINWFHEAEPDPHEGQDCLPLPFLQKRKHVRTSWEER